MTDALYVAPQIGGYLVGFMMVVCGLYVVMTMYRVLRWRFF